MPLAEGQRDIAAHRVADERATCDAQSTKRFGHRIGEEFHRMGLARDDRNPVSRQIERHDSDFLI